MKPAATSIRRRWKGLFVLGDAVPGRHRLVPRGELRVGGDPAFLFRTLEDALAVGVPAVVELALVFIGPLLRDVVRAVDRAARPVHEERLVRLESLVLMQPADRVVRQVFAEVVALLNGFWRQDRTSCCELGSARSARLRRRGNHKNTRSRDPWASSRTGRSGWSPQQACCAICPKRPVA